MKVRGRKAVLGVTVTILLAASVRAREIVETLTLEQCLQIAMENNLGLAAAREDVELAGGELREARSTRYPRLDAVGTYFRIESPPTIDVFDESVQLGRSNAFFVGLTASQTIYSGGGNESRIGAAEEGHEAQEETFQARAEQTAFLVHTAFYQVLLAKQLVEVRRASLEQLEAHAEEARERLQAGAASEYEALRAEVELANHRPFLVEAEHELASARDQLKRLLGIELTRTVDAVGQLELIRWDGNVQQAIAEAVSRRPEMRAADAKERAAVFAMNVARSGKKPAFSWFTSLFGTSPEYFLASEPDIHLNWIGGVTVALPVFDGFATEARVQQADAILRKARIFQQDLEQQIRLEVRTAHRDLIEAEATIEAQSRVIEQAERALAIARVRYGSGLGTELEVTDAQLALSQARVVRLEAVYQHAVGRTALRRAIGETLLPFGDGQ